MASSIVNRSPDEERDGGKRMPPGAPHTNLPLGGTVGGADIGGAEVGGWFSNSGASSLSSLWILSRDPGSDRESISPSSSRKAFSGLFLAGKGEKQT